MKIFCPKHSKEQLRVLRYTKRVLHSKRGQHGITTVWVNHLLCVRCNKAYNVSVKIKVKT